MQCIKTKNAIFLYRNSMNVKLTKIAFSFTHCGVEFSSKFCERKSYPFGLFL